MKERDIKNQEKEQNNLENLKEDNKNNMQEKNSDSSQQKDNKDISLDKKENAVNLEDDAHKKETENLKIQINELQEKLNYSNDKYLRLMAEFDNFKRRSIREFEALVEQANEKLIKDLIEVRENFERAFTKHEGADLTSLFEGIKMTYGKFDNILRKHGLEVFGEVSQEFDPNLHDALMKAPHEEIKENHIIEVCEKGYKLKGKIIKHAKVIVSSGKSQKQENEKLEEKKSQEETVFEVSLNKDDNQNTVLENNNKENNIN